SLNRDSTAGNMQFRLNSAAATVVAPTASTASTVFDGTNFHHIAGTYDSTTRVATFYANGAQVDGATTSPVGFASNYAGQTNRDLYLGRLDSCSPANSFTGTLDEVRVWARALSLGEIKVSNDMGVQTNVPTEIGEEEEASVAYTKRWEVTGAGTANNQVKTF